MAVGSGNLRRSNDIEPTHVAASQGLSMITQPSGIPAAANWSASSVRSAAPATSSRHLVTANWEGSGSGGRPARAAYDWTICSGVPAYTSYEREPVLKHACTTGTPVAVSHTPAAQEPVPCTAPNAIRPIEVVAKRTP